MTCSDVLLNVKIVFVLLCLGLFSAKQRRPVAESLPPIGVFWDIENCGVPCRKSALAVVSRIRERFFSGHREAEFMCVCDISKENREVIQELNYAQVCIENGHFTSSKNTFITFAQGFMIYLVFVYLSVCFT